MTRISPELVRFAKQVFPLDWHGIHGAPHWSRVRLNGLRLAAVTGANPAVVEYFAFLHDLGRQNDDDDPDHGRRGADIATDINGTLIDLTRRELKLLVQACNEHSDGHTHAGDITVMTCWDADRLDLGRVGITPSRSRLCTDAARDRDFLRTAWLRSLGMKPDGRRESSG